MSEAVARWEWGILLLLVLVLLVAELVSVRRSIRRAEQAKREGKPDPRS